MFNMRKPICFSCKDSKSLEDIIDMGAIAAVAVTSSSYTRTFHIEEL